MSSKDSQLTLASEVPEESDSLVHALSSVNFRVCEISKLVQRLNHLEQRVSQRAKWTKISRKITLVYNITCIAKFARLSRAFDQITFLNQRKHFIRWRHKYNWYSFTSELQKNDLTMRLEEIKPEIQQHRSKVCVRAWGRFTKNIMDKSKLQTFAQISEEHARKLKLANFFNTWINRLYRKQELRESRATRWINFTNRILTLETHNQLLAGAFHIKTNAKWFEITHKLYIRKIRKEWRHDRAKHDWYNLSWNYLDHVDRGKRNEALLHYSMQMKWYNLVNSYVRIERNHYFEQKQIACDTAREVRNLAYAILRRERVGILQDAQHERSIKLIKRAEIEKEKYYIQHWNEKAMIKRATRRLMRSTFSKAIKEYMNSEYIHAAITIQRWFLKKLHKQRQTRLTTRVCFLAWRRLPLRVTFNSVEFPEISLVVNMKLKFDLGLLLPKADEIRDPYYELRTLHETYRANIVLMNKKIEEVTLRNSEDIPLYIIPVPSINRPIRPLKRTPKFHRAIESMKEHREMFIASEPIPFDLDLELPISFLSCVTPTKARKLTHQHPPGRIRIDEEFVASFTSVITKRVLRTITLPRLPQRDAKAVKVLQHNVVIPELIDQYHNYLDSRISKPDFSLVKINDRSIEHLEKAEKPLHVEFVTELADKIDYHPIFEATKELYPDTEPVTLIEEKVVPDYKFDDQFFEDSIKFFMLDQIASEASSVIDPEYDYWRRLRREPLLIYDKTIHEEALEFINYIDVLDEAAHHIATPVSSMLPISKIEAQEAIEKLIEVDEERIERTMEEVYEDIQYDIDLLADLVPSMYKEEHLEDKVGYMFPIDDYPVEITISPLSEIKVAKYDRPEVDDAAQITTENRELKIVIPHKDATKLEVLLPTEAEEFILLPAEGKVFDSQEYKLNHIIKSPEHISDLVHKSLRDVPEESKPDLDNIYDLEAEVMPLELNVDHAYNITIVGDLSQNVDCVEDLEFFEEHLFDFVSIVIDDTLLMMRPIETIDITLDRSFVDLKIPDIFHSSKRVSIVEHINPVEHVWEEQQEELVEATSYDPDVKEQYDVELCNDKIEIFEKLPEIEKIEIPDFDNIELEIELPYPSIVPVYTFSLAHWTAPIDVEMTLSVTTFLPFANKIEKISGLSIDNTRCDALEKAIIPKEIELAGMYPEIKDVSKPLVEFIPHIETPTISYFDAALLTEPLANLVHDLRHKSGEYVKKNMAYQEVNLDWIIDLTEEMFDEINDITNQNLKQVIHDKGEAVIERQTYKQTYNDLYQSLLNPVMDEALTIMRGIEFDEDFFGEISNELDLAVKNALDSSFNRIAEAINVTGHEEISKEVLYELTPEMKSDIEKRLNSCLLGCASIPEPEIGVTKTVVYYELPGECIKMIVSLFNSSIASITNSLAIVDILAAETKEEMFDFSKEFSEMFSNAVLECITRDVNTVDGLLYIPEPEQKELKFTLKDFELNDDFIHEAAHKSVKELDSQLSTFRKGGSSSHLYQNLLDSVIYEALENMKEVKFELMDELIEEVGKELNNNMHVIVKEAAEKKETEEESIEEVEEEEEVIELIEYHLPNNDVIEETFKNDIRSISFTNLDNIEIKVHYIVMDPSQNVEKEKELTNYSLDNEAIDSFFETTSCTLSSIAKWAVRAPEIAITAEIKHSKKTKRKKTIKKLVQGKYKTAPILAPISSEAETETETETKEEPKPKYEFDYSMSNGMIEIFNEEYMSNLQTIQLPEPEFKVHFIVAPEPGEEGEIAQEEEKTIEVEKPPLLEYSIDNEFINEFLTIALNSVSFSHFDNLAVFAKEEEEEEAEMIDEVPEEDKKEEIIEEEEKKEEIDLVEYDLPATGIEIFDDEYTGNIRSIANSVFDYPMLSSIVITEEEIDEIKEPEIKLVQYDMPVGAYEHIEEVLFNMLNSIWRGSLRNMEVLITNEIKHTKHSHHHGGMKKSMTMPVAIEKIEPKPKIEEEPKVDLIPYELPNSAISEFTDEYSNNVKSISFITQAIIDVNTHMIVAPDPDEIQPEVQEKEEQPEAQEEETIKPKEEKPELIPYDLPPNAIYEFTDIYKSNINIISSCPASMIDFGTHFMVANEPEIEEELPTEVKEKKEEIEEKKEDLLPYDLSEAMIGEFNEIYKSNLYSLRTEPVAQIEIQAHYIVAEDMEPVINNKEPEEEIKAQEEIIEPTRVEEEEDKVKLIEYMMPQQGLQDFYDNYYADINQLPFDSFGKLELGPINKHHKKHHHHKEKKNEIIQPEPKDEPQEVEKEEPNPDLIPYDIPKGMIDDFNDEYKSCIQIISSSPDAQIDFGVHYIVAEDPQEQQTTEPAVETIKEPETEPMKVDLIPYELSTASVTDFLDIVKSNIVSLPIDNDIDFGTHFIAAEDPEPQQQKENEPILEPEQPQEEKKEPEPEPEYLIPYELPVPGIQDFLDHHKSEIAAITSSPDAQIDFGIHFIVAEEEQPDQQNEIEQPHKEEETEVAKEEKTKLTSYEMPVASYPENMEETLAMVLGSLAKASCRSTEIGFNSYLKKKKKHGKSKHNKKESAVINEPMKPKEPEVPLIEYKSPMAAIEFIEEVYNATIFGCLNSNLYSIMARFEPESEYLCDIQY